MNIGSGAKVRIWKVSTSDDQTGDTSAAQFASGVAKFQNNIFWNFASNGVAQPYWQNPAESVITAPANDNLLVNRMLTGISRTNFPPGDLTLDPRQAVLP